MSEIWFKELEERIKQCKDLPILKLEITFAERSLEKYDVIRIGDTEFTITSRPEKVEEGFKYTLVPCTDSVIKLLTNALLEL